MVKTRRSSHTSDFSPVFPRQRDAPYTHGEPPVTRKRLGGCVAQESFETLTWILKSAKKGKWYRILPVSSFSDASDDIQVATGIDWEHLLPLMSKCGLITSTVTSTVKEDTVNRSQWDEVCNSLKKHCRMQVTCVQPKRQKRVFYFCVDVPLYSNPIKQQQEQERLRKRPVYARPASRFIRDTVQSLAERIVNNRIYERVIEEQERRMFVEDNDKEEEEARVGNKVKQCVNFALALDLDRRPRLSRSDANQIQILESKQADERARNLVVHTAVLWGWKDPYITWKQRTLIAKAACKQVSYDLGYKCELAYTALPRWFAKLHVAIERGELIDPMSPSHSGSVKYLDTIEQEHQGYLHELFRYAQMVKGATSTFGELAMVMNEKSNAPGENRPTLTMSRRQLGDWFRKQGGKQKSPVEKPLLTDEHKRQRVDWCHQWFNILKDKTAPVAFLDEKWFYTTNRRKTLKILPKAKHEHLIPEYKRPKL